MAHLQGHTSQDSAYAIAELADVLACGEDSAALTFEHLAGRCRNGLLYGALKGIAADESRHQAWLAQLRQSLPPLAPDAAFRRLLHRFFCRLADEDPPVHFARIFALDSAVCQMLAAIQSRRMPLPAAAGLDSVIGRIQRDEARHVSIARVAAAPLLSTSRGRDVVAEVREGLIQVLAYRAGAFETLGVDPDRLWLRLRRNCEHGAAARCA